MKNLRLPDGQKIAYLHKKGKSPCIVLIHGLGANSTIWEQEFNFFAEKGCEVLSFDLRGHGRSNCNKSFGFNTFSQDLNHILEKLEIKKSILVGHSMGGLIALDFYQKFKGKVMSIILINSSYAVNMKTVKLSFPMKFFGINAINIVSRTRKKKPKYRNFQKFKKHSDLALLCGAYPSSSSLKFRIKLIFDMIKLDFSSILRKINVTVLIIDGKNDEIFRAGIGKQISEAIPNSKFHLISGGHLIILKNPMNINHLIDSFLSEIN